MPHLTQVSRHDRSEQFRPGDYVIHKENRVVVYRSHRVVKSIRRSWFILMVVLWRISEHDEQPEDLFVCPADELLPLRSYLLGILIFEVGSLIIDLR